jgi:tRNA pseudouridine32 synthase/23S rRNA pseudouridine746 synthase
MLTLPIVARHERFVVVDKPPNFLSVPGKGEHKQDCVASRVRGMFPNASGPLVVHRLDWETSGLLVLALDADAQRGLSMQFEQRRVLKRYTALVDGLVAGDAGEITLPIRADPERRPLQVVDQDRGSPSRTLWRVLARETDRTRIEFEPVTGRTHQLRVHAAAPHGLTPASSGLGHPILNDPLYGPGGGPGAPAPGGRLMLHASHLAFREPGGERLMEFRSPAPF